jgi:hypothetical protein
MISAEWKMRKRWRFRKADCRDQKQNRNELWPVSVMQCVVVSVQLSVLEVPEKSQSLVMFLNPT